MKTTQQTVLISGRLYFTTAIIIFLIPAYLHAEIYKCKNTQTGVIEYKQNPCDETQIMHKIEVKPKQSSSSRRSGELIYKNKLIKDLGGEVAEECRSKLSRRGYSKAKSEQQCNAAIERFAFCVVDAQKYVFPKKANDVFFSELERGKSEEEARKETKKRKHWGNISQQEKIRKMFLLQGEMEMCKDDYKKRIF